MQTVALVVYGYNATAVFGLQPLPDHTLHFSHGSQQLHNEKSTYNCYLHLHRNDTHAIL